MRYLLELLPALLPVDDEDDEEPEPVSVDVVLGGVVEAVVEVSLGVDVLVGEVVFAVEPGVALDPELLYVVLVPGFLLQPASAPLARAMAAR